MSNEKSKMTKEQKEKIKKFFDDNPVDKWMEYINNNSTSENLNIYKAQARKALTIANMVDYIETYHNTKEDKKKFKDAAIKPIEKKDENKQPVTDKNGNIVYETNEDGTVKMRKSVMTATKHFLEEYKDEIDLSVEKAPKKPSIFDKLKDW
jgi:hypothetical protein